MSYRQYVGAVLIMICLQVRSQYSFQYSDSLFNIGVNYYNEQNYPKAIDAFLTCKKYDCTHLDSTNHRINYSDMWIGCCYYLIGDEKEAKRYNPKYYNYSPIDRALTTNSDSLANIYESYNHIGDKKKILDILHKIIESETYSIGPANYWIANSIELCAREYEDMDSIELAASYYKKAYEIRKEILDFDHPDLAMSMIEIAYCRKELSIDTLTAINYYRKGFDILSQHKELDSYVCADRMHDLACLCTEKKDYESAISNELQAIAIFKRTFGVNNNYINLQIARGYNLLMCVSISANKYGDAERYGRKALKMRKELLGESHPYYINTLSTLATVYGDAGKYDEAIQLYSMCLNNFKMIEKEHEDFQEQVYFQLLENYSYVLSLNKDYETAIKQLTKLIIAATSSKYDWTDKIFGYKSKLAEYYAKMHDYDKAILIGKECLLYLNRTNNYTIFDSKRNPLLCLIGYYADVDSFNTVNRYCDEYGIAKGVGLKNKRELALFYRVMAGYFSDINCRQESISFLTEALKLAQICGEKEMIIQCYGDLSSEYYEINKNEESIRLIKEAISFCCSDSSLYEMFYPDLLASEGLFYSSINLLDSAIYFSEKACDYRQRHHDYRYINDKNRLVLYYKMKGDFTSAEKILWEIIETKKESIDSIYDIPLSTDYMLLIGMLMSESKNDKSVSLCRDYLKRFDSSDSNYLSICKGMVKSLYSNSQFDEAIEYGLYSLNCHEKAYGTNNKELITPLYDLSLAYFENGDFAKGMAYGERAVKLMESYTNKFSADYINLLEGMANFYSRIGLQGKSIESRQKAVEIASDIYGEDSSETIMIVHNLAVNYSEMGNIDKAIELGEKIVEIRKRMPENHSYLYAKSLGNLGVNYGAVGEYEQALTALNECIKIERDYYGYRSMHVATRLVHIGNVYDDMGNTLKGLECYRNAYSIMTELGYANSVNDDAIFIKQSLAKSLYSIGAYSECSKLLCGTLSDLKEWITWNSLKVQNQYRNTIWEKKKKLFLQYLPRLTYATKCDSLIGRMYDYSALFGKGLMLNTHNLVSRKALEKDSITRNLFVELSEAYALRERELSKGVNNRIYDLEDIDKKIVEIENSISESCFDDDNYKKNFATGWRDVQAKLSDKDLAIEFFSIQYPDNSSDSIIYIALTLKKNYENPKLIRLFDLKNLPKWDSSTPDVFYKYVWEPLETELAGVNNVFFSTWYSLNTIPIEHLPTPQGKFMSELYNMYRLSSTRELVALPISNSYSNVAIYGGLDYDNIKEDKPITNSHLSLYRGVLESYKARGGVDFLPYTLAEARTISLKAQKYGIKTCLYSGVEGTEESFKKLSNSDIDLIHLSTHGLYIEKPSLVEYAKNMNYLFLMQNNGEIDLSMNRSLLIMSGGNKLSHRDSIPEGMDDGILTANEISILNLQNVKMLVLSACQSGLGELSSEGVTGLQQGIKKAGVKTIIMALDNVDDKATQIFMEGFYEYLFSGKSKLQSLRNAQKYLRSVENGKYDNPKYWASFIMLDGLN